MIEDRDACATRECARVGIDQQFRVGEWPRNVGFNHGELVYFGQISRGILDRRIGVIGKYNSITRAPMNRAQHGVDTAGCVFNEGKPPRCRGEKVCEARRGVAQRNREDIHHEAHRLGFHLLAPARLCRLHIARCRAVRAVIEKMNIRIERPQAAHMAAETRVWCRQQGLRGHLLVGHWLHDGSLAGIQSIGRSKPNSVGISSDTVG